MHYQLQKLQPRSSLTIAELANDRGRSANLPLHMAATAPPPSRRKHYIPEWADKRILTQADIVRAIGADKATVSRWFSGNMPQDHYLDALVGYLELDDRDALFRHPDDDWMARFLRGRSNEEKERIRTMLEAAFPLKVA
jgi:hypothetical protein